MYIGTQHVYTLRNEDNVRLYRYLCRYLKTKVFHCCTDTHKKYNISVGVLFLMYPKIMTLQYNLV